MSRGNVSRGNVSRVMCRGVKCLGVKCRNTLRDSANTVSRGERDNIDHSIDVTAFSHLEIDTTNHPCGPPGRGCGRGSLKHL